MVLTRSKRVADPVETPDSLQDPGGGDGGGGEVVVEPDNGHGHGHTLVEDSSTEDEDCWIHYTVHAGAGDLAPASSPPVSAGQPADVRAVHGPVEAEGEEDSDDEYDLGKASKKKIPKILKIQNGSEPPPIRKFSIFFLKPSLRGYF